MRELKILIAAAAIVIPSTAHACAFHGMFGHVNFSNLSLLSGDHLAPMANNGPAASHDNMAGMRYIRFSTINDTFDDEVVEDDASGSEPVDTAYNPEDAATFR
ncbi:hypothetical protein [Parasphingopyxis sp.]|uniref:hypothetical protein n=1 Tax=Parasphingopyxis sp. TaxID=1920299 RepID=UPI00262C5296|nr:hypothetical protein [Parasphingopyxis sp.]